MSALATLPSWLDEGTAAVAGATPPTLAGALPGLAQARELAPLQRLQRLQESGLAESSGAGEPIYLAWRRFLRGRRPLGAGHRCDWPRCARPRHSGGPRWRSAAVGRGGADRRRPARQPRGPAAPPGRPERSRSRPPERRRRDPFARPRRPRPACSWRSSATATQARGPSDRPPTPHASSTRLRPGVGSPSCSPGRRAWTRRC